MAERIFPSALAIAAAGFCASSAIAQARAQVPASVVVTGEKTIATFQGVGAQVYECKAGSDGKLAWSFREPIATLLVDGKPVGRHYAGPNWEHSDGSAVVGKVI